MRARAHRAPLATVLIAVALSACAVEAAPITEQATPSPAQHAAATEAPLVATVAADQLLFPGSLLICSDLPYPPQEFFDEHGEPVGSDIEIGQEIARRLGLEARIVNSLFDTIIDAVLAGKCDIVISAQSITAEREQLVDMIPYFRAGQTFVVTAENPAGLRNEMDLCGVRVATQRGTIQSELVTGTGDYEGLGLSPACVAAGQPPIELVEYEKDDQALDAVLAGDVDTYFLDSPAAGYHVLQAPARLALMGLTLDIADQGISVPPDRPALRDAIRAALDSMIRDGTYEGILERYGVADGRIAAP
jgi:polar amino acid transport system substrate-binding protein